MRWSRSSSIKEFGRMMSSSVSVSMIPPDGPCKWLGVAGGSVGGSFFVPPQQNLPKVSPDRSAQRFGNGLAASGGVGAALDFGGAQRRVGEHGLDGGHDG